MFFKAQEILLRGEAIPEELAAKMLLEKINSPEVAHHGKKCTTDFLVITSLKVGNLTLATQ